MFSGYGRENSIVGGEKDERGFVTWVDHRSRDLRAMLILAYQMPSMLDL